MDSFQLLPLAVFLTYLKLQCIQHGFSIIAVLFSLVTCGLIYFILQHGGGQVFMSLGQLIQNLKVGSCTLGVILVESEASVSRHLRHCGLENNIQTLVSGFFFFSPAPSCFWKFNCS